MGATNGAIYIAHCNKFGASAEQRDDRKRGIVVAYNKRTGSVYSKG